MANLLTQQQKKQNNRERRLRLVAVVLVGILLVFLSGIVFLLPSYFLVNAKVRSTENQIAAVEQIIENQNGGVLQDVVTQTSFLLDQLEAMFDQQNALETIDTIVRTQGPGITFSDISYTRQTDSIDMRIVGVAATRADLLAFTERLGSAEGVGGVDVPIGHLAERTDIAFTLSFTVSQTHNE